MAVRIPSRRGKLRTRQTPAAREENLLVRDYESQGIHTLSEDATPGDKSTRYHGARKFSNKSNVALSVPTFW